MILFDVVTVRAYILSHVFKDQPAQLPVFVLSRVHSWFDFSIDSLHEFWLAGRVQHAPEPMAKSECEALFFC
ncbi:hypothetical protein [Mariprofundus sp. KV]|uniref:hypothetical protein n=1 Tax=Mariprofundus sp. KV TaxID=2608715 RepID=UPI0015A2B8BE|nr:hypothetical protein [Mariprofundus sp. KV]NWF37132.1 hypothetical protein [Mariprofundus sp. KV]